MADDPSIPIVFPCPTCKRFVSVDLTDRKTVRPVGPRKGDPIIVRTECPICRRVILQTVLR
jgi:hypothetical protein